MSGYTCETLREMEILNEVRRPIIFLRFNPSHANAWVREGGEWKVGNVNLWEEMLEGLIGGIKWIVDQGPRKDFERIEMYY